MDDRELSGRLDEISLMLKNIKDLLTEEEEEDINEKQQIKRKQD